MKRYLKSILLVLAIFLCLGTFYSKSAATSDPEFILKRQSGSEKAANSVAIQGYYQNERVMDNVMISSKGSLYDSSMSLLGKIDKHLLGYGENQQLEKEYRSFMRGKTGMNSFYQDEDFLLYATIIIKHTSQGPEAFKFEISMLEKATKAENSYIIQPSNNNRYLFVSVEDIQKVGNKLKILTRNITADPKGYAIDSERNELHVYTIDMKSKQVVDDQTVLTSGDDKDFYTNIYMLQETDMTQSNDSAFYYKVTAKRSEEQDEQVGSELIRVNLKTNQAKKLEIPPELKGNINLNVIPNYDNKMIYFALETKEGIKVATFDPNTEKVVNSLKIKFDQSDLAEKFMFNVKNGKAYALTSPEKVGQDSQPANLTIMDLRTGNQLYKGVITYKNPSGQMSKTDGYVSLDRLMVE
ncbi:hypothetical protein J7E81_26755 [Bacillus sp. ISL-18]|uniref:hypothetical protein n=1 Tax=Bacillus sp. ISL-18 TaxID=2819118 RepID=UPI001BEB23D3|nr:hypothetical protein [Bacillus sp. ISL-18]MBT2658779.1 hypothetical protein [Bacillus sp. ISL-18]